jgi:hypothetical protein
MTDDELDRRVRESILSEELDTAPLERSIRERIQFKGTRSRVPRWAFVAAAVTVLATAFFFRPQTPPICVAAAQDHEREIVNGEPRHWLLDLTAIQSLAEKQGVPASAVTALRTTGYRLERGRLCFLKKQIFLHLVYTKNGEEFSVYLRPPSGLFNNSVRGQQNLAYFETNRVSAVFVSHGSGAGALAFARAGAKVL